MRITKAIQAVTSNGQIKASDALAIAERADTLIESSYNLIKHLRTQVGTVDGEKITVLMNTMDGIKFNAAAYHYEKLPEGQE